MTSTGHGPPAETGAECDGSVRGESDAGRLVRILTSMDPEATDLHLRPMRPPLMRLHGKLVPMEGPPLTPAELERLVEGILTPRQRQRLEERQRAEFGYSVAGVSRFRATVFQARGALVAAFRRLPWELPDAETLGLPDPLRRVADLTQGLVLVCGPPSGGKTTTVAALVREIVDSRLVHVMTLEQPIELPLRDGVGSVTQQEIGSDVPSLSEGLESALSEDSDVIVVDGEMSAGDLMRLTDAASADRLVIVTFRAESVPEALEAWCETIPEQWRKTAMLRLAEVLSVCVLQRLVERREGGVVPAVELFRPGAELAEHIANGSFHRLAEAMRAAEREHGGRTLNSALAELVTEGVIDAAAALRHSPDPDSLAETIQAEDAEPPLEVPGGGDGHGISNTSELFQLLEMEEKYDRLMQRYQGLASERDRRVEDLERKLESQQRRSTELAHQLRQLTDEKEQILHAVEREARRFEEEEQAQRRRLDELEQQLKTREQTHEQRSRQVEFLERERRRTVEMVEAHCREYERRISRLQERLREHGIDPV